MAVSEGFNAPDTDIVFQSTDGVLFRIHKTNLVACTEGFSPPEHCTLDEVVPLTETSSVLELLFQFIYPQPQPDLEVVDFVVLALLAEAAEKYQVYSAINICTILMINKLPQHSEEILMHGLKHDCRKFVARAAPLLLDRALEDILPTFSEQHRIPWVRYHSQWMRVWKSSISGAPDVNGLYRSTCEQCARLPHEYAIDVVTTLSKSISALQDLNSVFPSESTCSVCCKDMVFMKAWRESLEAKIKQILTLPDILAPQATSNHSGLPGNASYQQAGPLASAASLEISFGKGADITFLSSDGIAFRLHRPNIEACTKNLLPHEPDCDSLLRYELPEDSSTLQILFQFLYPMPHPDLESVDFQTLSLLSIAAERYHVYPAINVCRIRAKQILPQNVVQHTKDVMLYAMRIDDREIMDMAAPLLVRYPVADVIKPMDHKSAVQWVEYYERWNDVARQALSYSSNRRVSEGIITVRYAARRRRCNDCGDISADLTTIEILCKLGNGARSLTYLGDTFNVESSCCSTSREDIQSWRLAVEVAIQGIPSFSTFE